MPSSASGSSTDSSAVIVRMAVTVAQPLGQQGEVGARLGLGLLFGQGHLHGVLGRFGDRHLNLPELGELGPAQAAHLLGGTVRHIEVDHRAFPGGQQGPYQLPGQIGRG